MRNSFSKLIADLREYRAYLPNHLLQGEDDQAEQTVERKMALMVAPTNPSVAILFSDIMSSTKLWGGYPEEMIDALSTHNKILREEAVRVQGYEVQELGSLDGIFFCVSVSRFKNAK